MVRIREIGDNIPSERRKFMAQGLLRCFQKNIMADIVLVEVSSPMKVEELRLSDKVLLLHGDYAKDVGMGVWGSLEQLRELRSFLLEQEIEEDLSDMLRGQLVSVFETGLDSSAWSGLEGLAYLKESIRDFLDVHRGVLTEQATLIVSLNGALTVAELGDLLDEFEQEEVQLYLASVVRDRPLEIVCFLLISPV